MNSVGHDEERITSNERGSVPSGTKRLGVGFPLTPDFLLLTEWKLGEQYDRK